jgi:dolichol-phosphate mannosyltransferase
MKAVLLLPTYNERENIITLLDRLRQAVTHSGFEVAYLVIDDSSPDGTARVVREYAVKHDHVILLTGKKGGLGKALLRGMEYAVGKLDADVILQMDADLSHDPGDAPKFLKAISEGADFAVGSRYIPGGSIPGNWGLHRKIFSIVANAIVRMGLGYPRVHDWTGGYRAYRKRFVDQNKEAVRRYSGYVFQIAFLHGAVKAGAKIVEIPIHFSDRRFGRSKIVPSKYIMNVFEYIFRARLMSLKNGPFKKFAVVGTIGFVINTLALEFFVAHGVHPGLASAVGAELAIISNFILNNRWTFRERRVTGIKKFFKFLQFNVTSIGAIIIQSGTVITGSLIFGIGFYRFYYLLGVGLGLIWNYWMYSNVIWKKSQ